MLLGAIKKGKTLKYYFDEFDGTIYFSNGRKAKLNYEDEFKYAGKYYSPEDGKEALHRKFKKNTGYTLKQVSSKKELK